MDGFSLEHYVLVVQKYYRRGTRYSGSSIHLVLM